MPSLAESRPSAQELADNGQVMVAEKRRHVLEAQAVQATRANLRRGIALGERLTADWQRCNEIEIEINQRKETLAAEHVAACSPLQRELASIGDKQIKKIQAREPQDNKLEARRRELLADIERLNEELKTSVAEQDKLLGDNWRKRREAGVTLADTPDPGDLVDTAPPALKLELRVAISAEQWAARRIDALGEKSQLFPASEQLAAELADAEQALAAAQQRTAAARQACIDA